jgi:methylmalonyl-CoA mutase cobalamin-binding subunit
VINGQTENSQTKQIVDAASQAGVKAVVLSEILTDGQSYIQWMSSILKTINPGT